MCDTTNGYFLDPEALECSSCESNGDGLDRIGSSPSLIICLSVAALVLIGFVSLCVANRGRLAQSLQDKAHAAKKLQRSAVTHVFKHLGEEFSKDFADDPNGAMESVPMRVNSNGSVTFVKKSKEYVPGKVISMTSTTRTSLAKISVTTIKMVDACDTEIETQVRISTLQMIGQQRYILFTLLTLLCPRTRPLFPPRPPSSMCFTSCKRLRSS